MAIATQPLLITGATGTLGQAFRRVCRIRGLQFVLLDRAALDIADAAAIDQALDRYQPWAVLNAAGYVRVDEAETDAARCYRENTTGPSLLAAACAARRLKLLTFSSDLVFGGDQPGGYYETDAPQPLGVYGRSKQLAEQAVLAQCPAALVVRTSAFFSAWDAHNFVAHALAAARRDEPFAAASDVYITPTYVPDLVNTSLDLLLDGARGIWHLANTGICSWAELGRLALDLAGLPGDYIVPRPAAEFNWAAPRPAHSALLSQHGALLPSVESGLQRLLLDEELLQRNPVPAALRG